MTDLLEKVLDAHGGLDNWRRVNAVDFRLTFRGAALAIKQQPMVCGMSLSRSIHAAGETLITPFPAPGSRGIFGDGRVTFETDAGVTDFGARRAAQVL